MPHGTHHFGQLPPCAWQQQLVVSVAQPTVDALKPVPVSPQGHSQLREGAQVVVTNQQLPALQPLRRGGLLLRAALDREQDAAPRQRQQHLRKGAASWGSG